MWPRDWDPRSRFQRKSKSRSKSKAKVCRAALLRVRMRMLGRRAGSHLSLRALPSGVERGPARMMIARVESAPMERENARCERPHWKTPLLACGKSRFGGCRPVVTGVSLEAIGCPISCSVVAPGAVTNLLKNFFISLLNPKQQATNDKRGAVRCAVNEIVSPSYPSYRSNHWIDFGSMDGRFVMSIFCVLCRCRLPSSSLHQVLRLLAFCEAPWRALSALPLEREAAVP